MVFLMLGFLNGGSTVYYVQVRGLNDFRGHFFCNVHECFETGTGCGHHCFRFRNHLVCEIVIDVQLTPFLRRHCAFLSHDIYAAKLVIVGSVSVIFLIGVYPKSMSRQLTAIFFAAFRSPTRCFLQAGLLQTLIPRKAASG